MKQRGAKRLRGAHWCLVELTAELFASAAHFAGACMQGGEQGPFIKARSIASVERADDCSVGALSVCFVCMSHVANMTHVHICRL